MVIDNRGDDLLEWVDCLYKLLIVETKEIKC